MLTVNLQFRLPGREVWSEFVLTESGETLLDSPRETVKIHGLEGTTAQELAESLVKWLDSAEAAAVCHKISSYSTLTLAQRPKCKVLAAHFCTDSIPKDLIQLLEPYKGVAKLDLPDKY